MTETNGVCAWHLHEERLRPKETLLQLFFKRDTVAGAFHEAAILIESPAFAVRARAVAVVMIVARMAAFAGRDHLRRLSFIGRSRMRLEQALHNE